MSTEGGVTYPDLDDWQALRRHLMKHADALKSDKALLEALGLQARQRHLIDFGPAALSRLEQRALKDMDVRRQLEVTAKANFDAQSETHGLVLSLMEARNPSDLARRLNEEARHRFGLTAAVIAMEDTAPVPLGWKTLDYGGVDYIIGENALSLLGPEGVCRVLFDKEVSRVKSAAVLRIALWREGRPGLVAFGSSDYDGFSADMGAELVAFVARVVERVAERWPVLA
ncbi:DUF484 family protein [Asticcacaulis sp. EMRT-3]|uniref:DUF484 family protein n=1 Tax=Asticcacaulis sp. EMRT-3 TaxID=3040349 RepID=UPI0024AF8F33|nr:DUF484 family protein [Asticcacaulis sp. EMRT-3]MDI7775568.1 DUF484 family protein [Asticcacaulis sp. EMRT-3]